MHDDRQAVDQLLIVHPVPEAAQAWTRSLPAGRWRLMRTRNLDQARAALAQDGPFAGLMLPVSLLDPATTANGNTLPLDAFQAICQAFPRLRPLVIADERIDLALSQKLVEAGVVGILQPDQPQFGELLRDLVSKIVAHRVDEPVGTAHLHQAAMVESENLVWRSQAMTDLLTRAARAAQVSDVPVLILGESGTGKQLLSDLIHRMDAKRSRKRLLSVNCSAISGTLAESTIFGHAKGAYTGAVGERKGIFRAANGGTVLLDEIGELDLALQPKLLRVLQERLVLPLGSDDEVPVDVRVIAATNRQLAVLVEKGIFRLDLFQRLNVITLEIPPLRERLEDVPVLVEFFVKKYANYYEIPIAAIDEGVYEVLASGAMRGNVRELENTVRQMLAFKTSGERLTVEDVPTEIRHRHASPQEPRDLPALNALVEAACRLVDTGRLTLPEFVDTCERLVLSKSLRNSDTSNADLARRLGLSRRTLYNKIRKHEL